MLMCVLQDREPRVGAPMARRAGAGGLKPRMAIHPTAIVDPQARIAASAEIGPHCIIGADVEIGARTRLMAHVYVEGVTYIGEDNIFFPYSTVGVASQDLKYKGERAETRIGSRNKIREFVSDPSRHGRRRLGHRNRRR